jgi:hypothetical protein
MNKNTHTRHIVESPVGGDVDRPRIQKHKGAGLVAPRPKSAPPRAGPAPQTTPNNKREAKLYKKRKKGNMEV